MIQLYQLTKAEITVMAGLVGDCGISKGEVIEMNFEQGQDFNVRLVDKTCEERTDEDLEDMIEEIREIISYYGFDIRGYGSWESARVVAQGELKMIQKFEREYE